MAGLLTQSVSCTAVVVVLLGGEPLRRCIEPLRAHGLPILIVGPSILLAGYSDDTQEQVAIIRCDESVPRRRAIGVAAATTDWVVIIEDTCEIGPDWNRALTELTNTEPAIAALGGPVTVSATLNSRGIALGCVEYGEFAPQRIGGNTSLTRLHGLCTVYRRSALSAEMPLLIDTDIQHGLIASGYQMMFREALAVTFSAHAASMATFKSRSIHGQIYGGILHQQLGLSARVVAATKCLLLPPVLAARAGQGIPLMARNRVAIWIAILSMTTGWAYGELKGVVTGSGRALEAWH